jgi:serine/threonine protein kinase
MFENVSSTQLRMNKALFRNELQKLLLLNNKYYTPTVIDFIETDSCSSLIMSEISGINLRDLLTFYCRNLSINVVITLIYKISLLLHDIHKAGLVYGDVKPSNFILNNFGQVFLIDLGSTCAINDPNYLKVHTPQYAAPEQIDESTTSPDYRFDVYGLGVLFREFLNAVSRESGTAFDYSLMDKCRKISRKMADPVASNRYETIGEVTAVLDLIRPDHGDAIMRSFANTIEEWDVDKLIIARRRAQSKDSTGASAHAPILHNYGEDYLKPMPMELLKLQMDMIGRAIERREIDGFCFLQNGWMSRADHREQVQFIKDYTDWFYGTHTDRRG